jgi:hypothetical protein
MKIQLVMNQCIRIDIFVPYKVCIWHWHCKNLINRRLTKIWVLQELMNNRKDLHPPESHSNSQWEQRLKTSFARSAASRLPVRVDSSSSLLTLDVASKGKHSRQRKVSWLIVGDGFQSNVLLTACSIHTPDMPEESEKWRKFHPKKMPVFPNFPII